MEAGWSRMNDLIIAQTSQVCIHSLIAISAWMMINE
jgi:hypothetical protein